MQQGTARTGQLSRRGFLAGTSGVVGALALGSLPAFAESPVPTRPGASPLVASTLALWYPQPADPNVMIQTAL